MPRPQNLLLPRKAPVQARSVATVQAIGQASLQVLQLWGLERLTTTRVAERAGVSVGTLYQYYPNREALLLAVLTQHLSEVERAMITRCQQMHGTMRGDMARGLVHAFLDAKLAHAEEAHALAPVALLTSGVQAVLQATQRVQQAVAAMLLTAADAWRDPQNGALLPGRAHRSAVVLTQALVGPVQALVEGGAQADAGTELRLELERLAVAYWQCD